jgi:hypothetical protein
MPSKKLTGSRNTHNNKFKPGNDLLSINSELTKMKIAPEAVAMAPISVQILRTLPGLEATCRAEKRKPKNNETGASNKLISVSILKNSSLIKKLNNNPEAIDDKKKLFFIHSRPHQWPVIVDDFFNRN